MIRPPTHVDLKGSLVVVSMANKLFIINWLEPSGIKLSPYPYLLPQEEETEEVGICSFTLPLFSTNRDVAFQYEVQFESSLSS